MKKKRLKYLQAIMETNSLTKYDSLNYKQYLKLRSYEKEDAGNYGRTLLKDELDARERVWKYLLGLKGPSEDIWEAFRKNLAYNSGGDKKVLKESIRHYMSLHLHNIKIDAPMGYADLTSAYPTALACTNYSLKNYETVPSAGLEDLSWSKPGYFAIFRLHLVVKYAHTLQLFTTNERMRYNGVVIKKLPKIGDEVEVMIDLYKCDDLQIDSAKYFLKYFPSDMIVKIISSTSHAYKLVKRPPAYNLSKIAKLKEAMVNMQQNDQANVKQAMVAFTGSLSNYDPGRRLIMLTLVEQVILDSLEELNMNSVHGCYIDAIYFDKDDYDVNTVTDIVYKNAVRIYRLPEGYSKDLVVKGEIKRNTEYAQNEFTIRSIKWQGN